MQRLLIGGAILILLVGSFYMGGSSSEEKPRPAPPPRRVVAPVVEKPIEKRVEEPPAVPRGLAMSDSTRLREADLEDVDRYEKAGRFQEALDAIDDAIQN